ncbi:hypothetical protein [Vulcanisaeta thermophila]|nr:hypothetical protein [Vulcanisaeta thermophila]
MIEQVSQALYMEAMNTCLKPWYTDTCRKCRVEFMRCLHEYLARLN